MTAVEFKGQEFEPREHVNRMRSLHLAKLARDGAKVDDDKAGEAVMQNMAALYELVEHVLRPEDFGRFMDLCDSEGVDDGELYTFTGKMIGVAAERPTERSSDSSDGPSTTPESSGSRLVELATERFPGRPDMQMAATAVERMSESDGDLLLAMMG
jgi:hypothetical protein